MNHRARRTRLSHNRLLEGSRGARWRAARTPKKRRKQEVRGGNRREEEETGGKRRKEEERGGKSRKQEQTGKNRRKQEETGRKRRSACSR